MGGLAPRSRGLEVWAIASTLAVAILACARASDEAAGAAPGGRRIVAIGGAVTETVYALGAGDRVVAVDTSSVYPEAATKLPQVGYQRALAAEPILALEPDLVLASSDAGPASTLDQLRAAGVKVVVTAPASTAATAGDRVEVIADALGDQAHGRALAAALEQASDAAIQRAATKARPRVLFVYARGGGTLMVSGRGTPADAMLALAGADNVIDDFDGYKPLSAEVVVAAAPDVILLPSRGLDSVGGVDGVLAMPGIPVTPAGKARRIVGFDDLLLLGFGPRLAEAIDGLAKVLGGA